MSRQRGFLVALCALVLTLVAVAPAAAGRRWCEADPVFLIAGRQVNVVTAIPEEYLSAVTGPVAVTLYVPDGVSAQLLATDAGYNGYGEVVSIVPVSWLAVSRRGVEAVVEVTLPASHAGVPVEVRAVVDRGPHGTTSGAANAVIPLRLVVRPGS